MGRHRRLRARRGHGAAVSIPATVFYLTWVRQTRRATGGQTALAGVIGALITAAAIAFLFI